MGTITAGHLGPEALAGGKLLPNVLDLQPGPGKRLGQELVLDACAMEMLGNKEILVELIPSHASSRQITYLAQFL